MYRHRITKEEVNQLPHTAFPGEIVEVDTPEKAAEAILHLRQSGAVGIDTETRPSFSKGVYHQVALLQIASETHCYLFRLNKIGVTKEIATFFASPKIVKVGLAMRDDVRALARRKKFIAKCCIDIQNVVNNYGILELGLQKIFAIVFNQKISKAQRLTNWENEVLTEQQMLYAATDAWATLRIYQQLQNSAPLSKGEIAQIKSEEREALLKRDSEKANE